MDDVDLVRPRRRDTPPPPPRLLEQLIANLRRHPRRHITMDEAFQCTIHVPFREQMAELFIEHYDHIRETYGGDAHPSLYHEVPVEEVVTFVVERNDHREGHANPDLAD